MATTGVGAAGPGDVGAILALFRQRGGKATSARRAVVQALLGSGLARSHLTAEEVFAHARRSCPELAESTVYRTLIALEELAIIEPVHVPFGPMAYHLLDDRPHDHVQCECCHRLFDVGVLDFTHVDRQLRSAHRFEIHPHRTAMPGLCCDCADTLRAVRPPP